MGKGNGAAIEELAGTFTGVLHVARRLRISGTVIGSVVVDRGGDVDLTCVVDVDLVVEPGGRCRLDGLVGGTVINRGGVLEIRGTTKGLVEVAGRTTVHRGAVVAGKKQR